MKPDALSTEVFLRRLYPQIKDLESVDDVAFFNMENSLGDVIGGVILIDIDIHQRMNFG